PADPGVDQGGRVRPRPDRARRVPGSALLRTPPDHRQRHRTETGGYRHGGALCGHDQPARAERAIDLIGLVEIGSGARRVMITAADHSVSGVALLDEAKLGRVLVERNTLSPTTTAQQVAAWPVSAVSSAVSVPWRPRARVATASVAASLVT